MFLTTMDFVFNLEIEWILELKLVFLEFKFRFNWYENGLS